MAGSKSVVLAALVANGAIAILKFGAFLLTGSPSMLSEVYHSISDTGNQVFLLVGIRYSDREANQDHPFGYGKAQFFYSFLVSVLLFGIAGWESVKHGYEAILHPHAGTVDPITLFGVGPFPAWYVSVVVLLGAIGFETYAFVKANAELQRQISQYGWSGIPEAFRKTSDVTTLTALTEDTIALAGIVLALGGLVLTQLTDNQMYDQLSAVLIGIMLMGFALALAWENKRLLLGESLPSDEGQKLRDIVTANDHVASIVDFRTVYFGPNEVIVSADIAFQNGLATEKMDDIITDIESELKAANGDIRKVYIEPEVTE